MQCLEFEFTVVMDLSIEGHVATASKDRTGLFDGTRLTPDSHTGRRLLGWLETSEKPTNAGRVSGIDTLNEIFRRLGLDDLTDEYQGYVSERYGVCTMNEMNADQVAEQTILLKQCQANEKKLAQFTNILHQRKLAA